MPVVSFSHQLESIRQLLGADMVKTLPLHGGCIAQVVQAWLDDGRVVVIKAMHESRGTQASLELEGWMLAYLAEHSRLPVPTVFHSSSAFLVMEALPGESRFNADSQTHAAELLAELHGVNNSYYGLERDTLIGGLPQPNPPTHSWLDFFAEHRLLYMAHKAYDEGKISNALLNRLHRFCERLSQWLIEPEHPSLLHGDAWTTNILAEHGRITGILDPAIYTGTRKLSWRSPHCLVPLGSRSSSDIKKYDPFQTVFSKSVAIYTISIRCWCMCGCSAAVTSTM